MDGEGKTVEVQSIAQARAELSNPAFGDNRTLYATVCFYYPQYKLEDVEQMPYRDVALLLRIAEQMEASRMYNYTLIASAPHSKNGNGVKNLIEHFRKLIKG